MSGYCASLQTNTFQGIVITNGNQSYALYTYKCGTLSSNGNRTNGTIGFNSDGNYFRNFPLSGTSRVNEVACLNLPNTLWSNLLYSLTPTSGSCIIILTFAYLLISECLDLDVSIVSSPSGPIYPASTWIEFQCHVTSGSGVYSYKWRAYCSSTNILIEETIAGPPTIFRMKSTPSTCINQIECVAEDMVLPLSGSTSVSIVTVTGNAKHMYYAF